MSEYKISNDFFEIISGTTNKLHPLYMEASKNVDANNSKSIGYIKNFITSIENIANKEKTKDERITKSRGNIRNFSSYQDLTFSIEFLKKNLSGNSIVNSLSTILKSLEKYQPQYTEGYEKNIRLVVLEYESAVDMLVTATSMIIAENIDIEHVGTSIKIKKNNSKSDSIIYKTTTDLSKQLDSKNHKQYLEEMIKSKEYTKVNTNISESYTFTESSISDSIKLIDSIITNVGKIGHYTVNLVRSIKASLFGILPIIRSCLYLKYKKKADTILSLEQQVEFIENNIEQLENRTNMDPSKKEIIIKKQKAAIEAYKKKAAKLRAQLSDGEREASNEINKEDPSIKNTDDDFVLENGVTVTDFFLEGRMTSIRPKMNKIKMSKFKYKPKVSKQEMNNIRIDKFIEKFPLNNKNKKDDIEDIKEDTKLSLVKKAIDNIMKDTAIKSIRLNPGKQYTSDDNMNKRTDTKIGGTPYWPNDKEFPTCDGKPMLMLAQLNFSKLPKLEGYPSSGIMQFFVYDIEYSSIGDKSVKVVYHKDIISEKDMLVDIPRSTIKLDEKLDKYLSIEGVYYPTASIEDSYINPANNEWNDKIIKALSKEFNKDWKKVCEVPNDIYDLIWKNIPTDYCGCRVGGHPYFTQSDPRDPDKDEVLLIQLDSEAGMMWGDCGIANFFTSKEALRSLNFDNKVLFTWDCC